MAIEHRKYQRFYVKNTFAALGSKFEIVGKVKDISIKGLALSYLCESIKTASDRDFSQVYISTFPKCHATSYMTFNTLNPLRIIVLWGIGVVCILVSSVKFNQNYLNYL